jgi:1,2-diacylglycerol 3-alpha-glucosyltransferase
MGVFGLIFANRLIKHFKGGFISAGIYHQNEFLYKSNFFYFPRASQKLFNSIPSENIIFFNDSSRKNYEHFFGTDYNKSIIVPIGIELDDYKERTPITDIYRIVSIGNLVEFKTYNEHIINLIPTLLPQYPNLRYDIYGNGPNETKLNNLVAELNLKDNVNFNGSIPYDQFQSTVSGAGLFVGSGTALIEAAAMGIPALVGIESIETAETYGFLSDIKGLSYNEDVSYIKKTSIIDNIKELLSNENYRVFISDSCQKKSQDFSIITTVNGFLSITGAQSNNYQNLPNIRMLFSLFFMALFERTRLISSFAERRNQSY